jgi:hypothetical protein
MNPKHRGLIIMSELMVAQGGWPVFASQAQLVASYIEAKQRGRKNADYFDSHLRLLPPPNYKNRIFSLADRWHVDVPTTTGLFEDASNWLLEQ